MKNEKCETSIEDRTKNRLVINSGTVPSPVTKLMLALEDANFRSLGNTRDVVVWHPAKFFLSLREALERSTQRFCFVHVNQTFASFHRWQILHAEVSVKQITNITNLNIISNKKPSNFTNNKVEKNYTKQKLKFCKSWKSLVFKF